MSGREQVRCWTSGEDDILRDLWLEGVSTRRIALALTHAGYAARTRNAVIGRVHRLGLNFQGHQQNGGVQQRAIKARRKHRSPDRKASAVRARPAPKPRPDAAPVAPLNRPLIGEDALQPGLHCRAVAEPDADGNARYCGHPAHNGGSWCAHHDALVFDRSKPKRRPFIADERLSERRRARWSKGL